MILFLSFVLRFWRVGEVPPALNWDEVSIGYNAYSIMKTGRDEWGIKWPLIFRGFGDYKLPLYIYLTTLPVDFLGLTPLAVRFISILAGSGLVLVAYFVGERIFKSKTVGLWAAFLTVISPWDLFLSRVAVEANLAAFLFALGGLFWLSWWQENNGKKLFLAFLFWGLTLHTYNSARILVPILFLITFIFSLKKKKVRRFILPAFILGLFFIPIVFQVLNKSGEARFFWVSPVDQGAVNRIIEKRETSSFPVWANRLAYNRVSYFFVYSVKNYFAHFNPKFLFFEGGSHYQFSIPGSGLLYLVMAPFLLVGLIISFKKRHWGILFWFLAAFIPSAITRDSPHALRSILILPLPMVLASLSICETEKWLKKKSKFSGRAILWIFFGTLLVSFGLWWRSYWQVYPTAYSWAWQYGYKQAVEYTKENYSRYDQIIFTKKYGEPHEFVLFYWPWEPSYYQQDPKKIWDYHTHWYWVDAFDKFEFWNDWEVKGKLKTKAERLLLVTSPGNWIEGGKLLKTINFLDGSPAFEIVAYP